MPDTAPCVAAAAVAAAEARKKDQVNDDPEWWKKKGGEELESALAKAAALGDSPVRLVDAHFLVELNKRGGRLARRRQIQARRQI